MTGDGGAALPAWIDAWAPVEVDQRQDVDIELRREQAEAILLAGGRRLRKLVASAGSAPVGLYPRV
jgi:hypothetical protein